MNLRMNKYYNEWMNEKVILWTCKVWGWINIRMNEWMNEWKRNKWTCKVSGWINITMKEWMKK